MAACVREEKQESEKKTSGFRRGRQGGRGEDGSIVLEASMIFPWVLLITLMLIILSVWILVRCLGYFSAAEAAEKAAFAWPHSSAELRAGAYPAGEYDGLYWRLKDDVLLSGLFGRAASDNAAQVPIGEQGEVDDGGTSLAKTKLRKSAASLSGTGASGTAMYRNRLWKREVTVETADAGLQNVLSAWGWSGDGKSEAVSLVSEPPEMIRSFDLVRYYRAKMRAKGSGAGAYREQAAGVLEGLK
ncbi:hypothetical protein [Cohnella caldifontis]|uniref:hypothetical protein n=1 Tax=Cohnella caldifontis TaxID=3027471 RepID=UPI0023EDFE25|nr:hypothetical protein [Cohnella sp. YIM B05605]